MKRSKQRRLLFFPPKKNLRDCAIITWKGGGGGLENERGGIGENDNKREEGLDVKFNTYVGGITFSFLFANWKRSGRVIGVQI